ncbi:photosystem I reaction center subunit PsaK [Leptothermofonsia sichuanensis E412]|uniref:photosystem I reaction center subunit PsaK n=1 Tax=Leptothermofonsia sichuanensis TaxID=2917832 RepID=UPI001CA6D663|nr:photosystem I reaction center subunit PsaK [Leptothermofonsia sichuanensis]QZZ19240.1 photosystem I reaction center subunit PsaK [Leptothermofonsia sichuanensis E412]
MFTSTLLAVAARSSDWSPAVGFFMILANVIAIAIARQTIQKPNVGPEMPSSNLFGGFSAPAVAGTLCFGHILGAGIILGLTNLGVL